MCIRDSGYTVQNICIETLPGEHVFGSIYTPIKKGKHPLIICPDEMCIRDRAVRAACEEILANPRYRMQWVEEAEMCIRDSRRGERCKERNQNGDSGRIARLIK